MTRQLTVVEQFEHGTLVEVAPHSEYADVGTVHAYYVPEKARQTAGMAKAQKQDITEEFYDEDGGYDWAGIRDLVSAAEIVERVEAQTLNQVDGDVGNERWGRHPSMSWRNETPRGKPLIPDGVIKFGDPDADTEDAPHRDPVERGRCWAVVQDRMLAPDAERTVDYQDDVQQATTPQARVPLDIVKAGDKLVAAYLVAHDHHDRYIAHVLDRDDEWVRNAIKTVTKVEQE